MKSRQARTRRSLTIKMGEPENIDLRQFVPKKYILREDKVGRIVPKGRLSSFKMNLAERVTNTESVYQALRGDLFQQLGQDRQPVDPHLIAVTSIEHDNRELETETTVLSEILEEVAELLLPVPSAFERYKIFTSRDSLDKALDIKLKEHVIVKIRGGKEQHGILRYKGRLSKRKGTYFGVQLQVRYLIIDLI